MTATKRGKVSIEEASELIARTKGRENKNRKYAFYLGFVLGDKGKKDKHEKLRAILSQKRFRD